MAKKGLGIECHVHVHNIHVLYMYDNITVIGPTFTLVSSDPEASMSP